MSDVGAIIINCIVISVLLWFIYTMTVGEYLRKKKDRDEYKALIDKYWGKKD